MNIKKCLVVFLAICFAFGTVGCQGSGNSAMDGSSSGASSSEESIEDASGSDGEDSSSEGITEIVPTRGISCLRHSKKKIWRIWKMLFP